MGEVKQVEEVSARVNQTMISENGENEGFEHENDDENHNFSFKNFLWHGGSVYDAWFSCASNQVHSYPFNSWIVYL